MEKTEGKPKIFIISGSAGAGKDSVIKKVRKKTPNIHWAITTTSKKPRPDESEGNPYYFIPPKKFQKMINQNAFLEFENVYDDKYFGMTKKEIHNALKTKKNIIWQIEYRGHRKIRRIFPDQIVSIFIAPPNLKIAEKRIRERSDVSQDFIKERLELAKKEIAASVEYDYKVINHQGKLDQTVKEVLAIIKKETQAS